jgi:hypothetical protein
VIGVMPANFTSDPPADIFIPLQPDPDSTNQGHYLSVAGRLKPGERGRQRRGHRPDRHAERSRR